MRHNSLECARVDFAQTVAQLPTLPKPLQEESVVPWPILCVWQPHLPSASSQNLAKPDKCQDAKSEIPGDSVSAALSCIPKVSASSSRQATPRMEGAQQQSSQKVCTWDPCHHLRRRAPCKMYLVRSGTCAGPGSIEAVQHRDTPSKNRYGISPIRSLCKGGRCLRSSQPVQHWQHTQHSRFCSGITE